jgi:type VI secretion system protein ImpH
VRFTSRNTLTFPASQIQQIREPGKPLPGDRPEWPGLPSPEMEVNFIGLQGPSGVLPNHYTLLILDLERQKDNPERDSFKSWLNLFNHRLTSLFYRTSTKYRPSSLMVSGINVRPGGFDPFTEANLALIGFGQLPLRGRIGRLPDHLTNDLSEEAIGELDGQRAGSAPFYQFDDRFLILHGGGLARQVRTAESLRALLEDYLGTPVEIEQFAPRVLRLPAETQTRLSSPIPGEPENPSVFLGQGALCGQSVVDAQNHFRIRIGPVCGPLFNQFLSAARHRGESVPSPLLRTLVDLVRLHARGGFDFELLVLVPGAVVPDPVLEAGPRAPVLGQSVWLCREKPPGVLADLSFSSVHAA